MKYLTSEQVEEFLSTLTKKYHRDEFYDFFLDYLESNHISIYDESEENILEQEVFNLARERGFIGYDIICEVTNIDEFKNKLSEQVRRYGYYIFHFMYEIEDESSISTTAVWEKWNQLPPLGWVGGWCSCGHFYPYTFDMAEMNLDKDEYTRRDDILRPRKITIEEIKKVVFCSDDFFRLYLTDNTIVIVKPYKMDAGLSFKFTNTILD